MADPRVIEWYLHIRPEKISWLRFILEGYDGLALLSTISASTGLVRIQTLECRFLETMRLLEAMAADLSLYRRPTTHTTT
jgi:hypothetical protein